MIYVNPDGLVQSYEDVLTRIDVCKARFETVGFVRNSWESSFGSAGMERCATERFVRIPCLRETQRLQKV